MHFHSAVTVARPLAAIATFFEDPANLGRWDRSVAQVVPTSPGPVAAGYSFDTISPSGMRMSYRITAHESLRGSTIALVSSPYFRRASWEMRYESVPAGTRIDCSVDFTLRPRAFLLAVPLLLTQRRALARDLSFLKAAIEESTLERPS